MKNILILGSEGFIGSNLVSNYIRKGWNVCGIDRPDNPSQSYNYTKILGLSEMTSFLLMHDVQYIVNAAGSGNVGFSMEHPLNDFESNCLDTAKVLDAIRVSGKAIRYLHISSAAVYGNPSRIPVRENDHLHPLSPYGWHKLISEQLCKEYLQVYGIRTCIVRPFSVYGPGLRKQLFWDLYHKAAGRQSVELFGTGKESRDFIYITDLAMAIDMILEHAAMEGEVFNLASGIETSIEFAASLFTSHFQPGPELIFNGRTKAGDPLNWKADITMLSELGFSPTMTIEKGLADTFQWIKGISKQ